jgi:DNA replicative helicase MCM subunit Mcm2 (Cdc46/Mcm family)
MEQQTISSAKAGIVAKLNARTSIVAACNPNTPGQKYNPELSIADNTSLNPALLSRFDLIFTIVDYCDFNDDLKTCEFILGKFLKKEDKIQ